MQPFLFKFRQLIMITKLFLLASISLTGYTSFSQCCPYVDPIEMIPVSPSTTDSIYVVTNVTTPNAGAYLGYTIIDLGSTIRIEACYFSGMLTVLQSYTDTINLGVKPAGTYNIEFVAYQSGNDITCDYSDSNEVAATITVVDLSGMDESANNAIQVYPNPVDQGLIYVNSKNETESIRYLLINALGQTVLEGSITNSGSIDVSNYSGVFYLSVFTASGIETRKILIQ
jgi:hypothetical protein